MTRMFGATRAVLAMGLALSIPVTAAAAVVQDPDQDQDEREQQNVEEIVVVTASRTRQLLLEAPTAMTVIDSADIALSPAQNYADLLRGVPGLNVSQTSARDLNMSSRASTNTLDASQLVLIDGRSVYQDFFGFVAWDLLPLDFAEIEQIEVIRGPGSAVWGANAMSGVVNIITKTPRSQGNSFRFKAAGGERNTGSVGLTYVGARPNAAYRVSASYFTQDAWDRPGPLPNGIPRDNFANDGTNQPKIDARFDFNSGDGNGFQLYGGAAGTGGTIHTGIGPFQIQDGSTFWYARTDYNRDDLNVRAYVNVLDGQGTNLLNGLLFLFESDAYDLSVTNTTRFDQHAVTYGANYRSLAFDLSIAPGEDSRTEGGGFVSADFHFNDHVSLTAGTRVDTFSTIDGSVVSPRGALLVRPTGSPDHVVRVGFGRAFRAPSLINNFLDITIFNAVSLPFVGPFVFPSSVKGNPNLSEERLDQIELGYRGSALDGDLSWDVALYRTETKDSIDFFTSGIYTQFNPPPGWPLPPFLLPPSGSVLLPSDFTYRNIGETVNKGFEIGLKFRPLPRNNLVMNYSYQDDPEVTGINPDEIGRPANHRFSVGWNGYSGPLSYGATVNHVGEAYWTDVLDARFFGTTDSYTTVDATLGYMLMDGRAEFTVRATNLTDKNVLQHIYGDIIGRRIVAQMALSVR